MIVNTDELIREALDAGALMLPDSILALCDTFCGCGNPESAWAWVSNYLEAKSKHEIREEDQGGSGLVAAYLLDRIGLTEHGGSICGAWLTGKGKEVLTFLQIYGIEWFEEKWIGSDGVCRGNYE